MVVHQDPALVSRALGCKCVAIGWGGQVLFLVISQERMYHLVPGPHSMPDVVKCLPFARKGAKPRSDQRHLVYQVSQSHFPSRSKCEVCEMCLSQKPFSAGLRAGFENEVTTKFRFSGFPIKSISVTDQCDVQQECLVYGSTCE